MIRVAWAGYLALVLLCIAVCVITNATLMLVGHASPGSSVYWLGFAFSELCLAVGVGMDYWTNKPSAKLAVGALVLGLPLVFVGDVIAGLALSCALDDCL